MKELLHSLLLITISIFFSSCIVPIPLSSTYYAPEADVGTLKQSECGDSVGPYNQIIIPGSDGVNFEIISDRIGYSHQATHQGYTNRVLVTLTITIPEGVHVQFEDNMIKLQIVPSGEEYFSKTNRIWVNVNPNFVSGWGSYFGLQTYSGPGNFYTIDIFSILEGGNYTGWWEFNKQPDQFLLIFPEIKINDRPFQIPNISFKFKKGHFLYPINC